MMKRYIYTGPLSGVSLKGHGDIMLIPGAAVTMPEEHGYTERLVRKWWLKEVDASAAEVETEIEKPKRRK